MLQAAGAAHVCEFWKHANQFGAKGPLRKKLERKLRQLAPVKDEKLPEGRVLQEWVEAIVAAWAAGDTRNNREGAVNPRKHVTITC
mmetsp:Transcript_32349/g.81617  ORF Transcript_32349/g.81617 Transcript_32349/m.81617 type:complete len:86 (-) Transcript_32349:119-376(-)